VSMVAYDTQQMLNIFGRKAGRGEGRSFTPWSLPSSS
jgi:hypothetical protein